MKTKLPVVRCLLVILFLAGAFCCNAQSRAIGVHLEKGQPAEIPPGATLLSLTSPEEDLPAIYPPSDGALRAAFCETVFRGELQQRLWFKCVADRDARVAPAPNAR